MTPEPGQPWPRSALFRDGRLLAIAGHDVDALAERFGTPLWVVDRGEVVARARAYRDAFPGVRVVYAAKALCVTGVLQLLAREGLGVDVASEGELATAANAGVPMDRVLLHGNNKSVAELELAARLGVGAVVADSFDELERLERVGSALGHRFPIALRVTPGVEAHTHEYVRTGQDDSKFGFTLSAGLVHRAVERVAELPHVELRGLHSHVGSQILRADAFAGAAAAMVDLVADLRDRCGVELVDLNLGGGLGIPYTDESPPPLGSYAAALLEAVDAGVARHGLPPLRLTIEPGRSLVGPAGVTLYRVGTVKTVPGVRTYVSVDGGMSDNIRPALYDARYAFAPAGARATGAPLAPVAIVGKHCESGDILGRDVPLPADTAEGDLLAVAATGAYGHAMASNYNRLPRPAMVLAAADRVDVLVRRETVEDVLALDAPLDA